MSSSTVGAAAPDAHVVGVLVLLGERRTARRSGRSPTRAAPLASGRRRCRARTCACASAHAAAVAIGIGSGFVRPTSRSSTSERSQPTARWSSGPVSARLGPARSRPTACAGPALVGVGGRQREQLDPRAQPLLGLEPGVAERHQPGAVHARRPCRSAGGRRRGRRRRPRTGGCRCAARRCRSRASGTPRRRLAGPGSRAGTAAACRASCSASITAAASCPASSSRSRWSPTCQTSRESSDTGIASASSSGSNGVARSSRSRRNVRTGCIRNRTRSSSVTSSGGRGGRSPSSSGGTGRRAPAADRAPASAASSKENGRCVGPRRSGTAHSGGSVAGSPALRLRGS